MSKTKALTVFYSWQTDLPNNTNRGVISHALEAAGKQLQVDTSGKTSVTIGESERPVKDNVSPLKLIVDQATAGVPGSPHIAQTILEKIAAADVFVADISTINSTTRKFRKTPNPNVLFELGYAVAHLGWKRIILVQNSIVTRKIDIPFDIQGYKFISYALPKETPDEIKKEKGLLASTLRSAILEISEADSPRPFKLQGMSEEEVRRIRDRETLTKLFSHINVPILEKHLQDAPTYYSLTVGELWDEFDSHYNRATFYLHDESLKKLIQDFADSWRASMPRDETDYYRPMPDPCTQKFISADEASRFHILEKSRAARRQLDQGTIRLTKTLKSLLDYVQKNYPEINIEMLGLDVGKNIHDHIRKIRSAR